MVALYLHVQQLGSHRQGAQSAVAVGDKADALRPGAQTAQTAQQADGGGAAAGGLAPSAGDAHLHHVGFSLGTLEGVDLNIGLGIDGAQVLLHGRAGGGGRIENVDEFNYLLDKHGKNLLSMN